MAEQLTLRTRREQRIIMGKLAVGIVVGAVFTFVVAPIVLAIVVGLAEGH